MASRPQPVKLFTLLTTFRYDKPQKGRFREFHQIDFEAIGEADPLIDAELVGLQWRLYADARPAQPEPAGQQHRRSRLSARRTSHELTEYFRAAPRRPVRRVPAAARDQPAAPARRKEARVPGGAGRRAAQRRLPVRRRVGRTSRRGWATSKTAGIPFTINPRLVRGLDYYTRSVWEVWPPVVGAQSTLGGGGRYDGLAEQLGGRPTPGVGFASGVERIILELKDQQVAPPPLSQPCAYLVYQNEQGKRAAFRAGRVAARQRHLGGPVVRRPQARQAAQRGRPRRRALRDHPRRGRDRPAAR